MKFLEKVLVVLALIGIFVRVMMWQGGELYLTVAFPSLAVLYLLMNWSVFKHKEQGHNVFLSFISGTSFSIVLMGILFKLMIWRGGNTLILIGLSFMILSKLLGLYLESKQEENEKGKYFKYLFMRYYLIAGFGVILLLIPYGQIVAVYHRDDPKYVMLFNRHFNNPENLEYRADFLEHRRNVFKQNWIEEDHFNKDNKNK